MNRYIVPDVSPEAQVSRLCPHCGQYRGRIHQYRRQAVVDTRLEAVTKIRMFCPACEKTWTCQPEGVKRSSQRSQRVKAVNVLLYALGLSYRGVAAFLSGLGVAEDRTTILRDVVAGLGSR